MLESRIQYPRDGDSSLPALQQQQHQLMGNTDNKNTNPKMDDNNPDVVDKQQQRYPDKGNSNSNPIWTTTPNVDDDNPTRTIPTWISPINNNNLLGN